MNWRKIINTIFWTQTGDWFVSSQDLANCSLAEQRECQRILRNFIGLGFAPLLSSLAYVLVLCELFPFIKHLVNDTKIIDWMMAGFMLNAGFHLICLIFSIKSYANQVSTSQTVDTSTHGDMTDSCVQQKNHHGLTIHNAHLDESNLKAVLQNTFGTKYQKNHSKEIEQEHHI